MTSTKSDVIYRHATSADVESMATIVPRAYAPDAFLPQIIPDTALNRQWWMDTFLNAIKDPAAQLLVAVDGAVVVGVFTMHYLGPDSPASTSSGVTSVVPLTPDHSDILTEALAGLAEERKSLMGDKAHFLVELVGVDRGYQSQGVGRKLNEMACEIADQKDAAIYLQTSAAKNYYIAKLALGFQSLEKDDGDDAGGTIIRKCKSERQKA